MRDLLHEMFFDDVRRFGLTKTEDWSVVSFVFCWSDRRISGVLQIDEQE